MGTPSKLSVIRTSPRRQDGEPRGEAPVHGASSELFAAFASRDPATLPSDGDEEDLDEREVAAAAAIALAASRRQQQ